MTSISKKQLSTALLFISSALMAAGATLTAYDGSRFEDSGPYVIVIGGILGIASLLLKRNTQQCPEQAEEQ
jgi:hypothetical protein